MHDHMLILLWLLHHVLLIPLHCSDMNSVHSLIIFFLDNHVVSYYYLVAPPPRAQPLRWYTLCPPWIILTSYAAAFIISLLYLSSLIYQHHQHIAAPSAWLIRGSLWAIFWSLTPLFYMLFIRLCIHTYLLSQSFLYHYCSLSLPPSSSICRRITTHQCAWLAYNSVVCLWCCMYYNYQHRHLLFINPPPTTFFLMYLTSCHYYALFKLTAPQNVPCRWWTRRGRSGTSFASSCRRPAAATPRRRGLLTQLTPTSSSSSLFLVSLLICKPMLLPY